MKPLRLTGTILILTVVLQAAACAPKLSPEQNRLEDDARKLIETDERQMTACQNLGSVTATGKPNPVFSNRATRNLKAEVKRRAVVLGATHIVWLYAYESTAAALAFECPQD